MLLPMLSIGTSHNSLAPQNEFLNLIFLKGILSFGNIITRNGRKMAKYDT